MVAGMTTRVAGRWGFAVPRPRRFVNRPYGDVGEWWDAGNGMVQTPAVRTNSCCSGDLSRSSFDAINLFKAFM